MKKILLPLLLLTGLCGCYNDNEEDLYPITNCETRSVTYSLTIKPIVQTNCARSGCHDAATASSGINLETYQGLKNIATDGRLIAAINHQSGVVPMPKDMDKLPQCTLDQIAKWVTEGALNN